MYILFYSIHKWTGYYAWLHGLLTPWLWRIWLFLAYLQWLFAASLFSLFISCRVIGLRLVAENCLHNCNHSDLRSSCSPGVVHSRIVCSGKFSMIPLLWYPLFQMMVLLRIFSMNQLCLRHTFAKVLVSTLIVFLSKNWTSWLITWIGLL